MLGTLDTTDDGKLCSSPAPPSAGQGHAPTVMPPEPSLALFTDRYQLTMAQAYWRSGQTAQATFSLLIRTYPRDRAYFVFAGLEDVLDYLQDLRFSEDDVRFLRSMGGFGDDFLEYLGAMRFTGTVRAMPEGSVFFADEPAIEVTGPIIEAQIAETLLLNQINLQTILATKASRVVHAADGRAVVDFGARRTHGTDAGMKFARVSYMAGYAGTSLVLAGKRYGIPTFGTMAHSFVTSFMDELDSFRAYADSFPDSTTLLVDTYSTITGTENAIKVGLEMRHRGYPLRAIRLDSGDLLDLSIRARTMLDAAGLQDLEVLASGGLDEFEVDRLLSAGAPIDGFGVGTKVGVSADAPWTDCAYKLVEYDGRPVLKLSTHKQSLPGRKQVYRHRDAAGVYVRDVIALKNEPTPSGAEPLLSEVMRDGRRVRPAESLVDLRRRFAGEFASLPPEHKALSAPAHYPASISSALTSLRDRLAKEASVQEGLDGTRRK